MAELSPDHGETKQTPGRYPTHTSWWPADDLDPDGRATLFSVASEVES